MYSVVVDDYSKIQKLLSIAASDWITVIANEKSCILVQETTEILAILQLRSQRSNSDADGIFRVKKELLKSMVIAGVWEFYEQADGRLNFNFTDGRIVRGVITTKYQAFSESIQKRVRLLGDGKGGFNASVLQKVCNVSKSFSSYLSVDNGIAYSIARDGTRLFAVTDGVPSLCLSNEAVRALFQCSDVWRCTQEFVCASENGFSVIAQQSRTTGVMDCDLSEVKRQRSAAIATINFADVVPVLRHYTKGEVTINLRTAECCIKHGEDEFHFPVERSNFQIAERYDGCVPLNTKVLLDVVAKLDNACVGLKVKKYFVELDCDGFTILCK